MAIDELKSLVVREFDLILKTTQSYLARSPISQQFGSVLWEALSRLFPHPGRLPKSSLTILLTRLSFLACGGDAPFPPELTTAWYLYYLAADIMDGVQDQDIELERQAKLTSPAEWLNLASATYFLANIILVDLLSKNIDSDAVQSIMRAYHERLIEMCEGQHQDITSDDFSLQDYLSMLRKKSGSFFAIACYAGARLATDNSRYLERLSEFGTRLGVMVQILDDLEDWKTLEAAESARFSKISLKKSLPALYTLEVLPEKERSAFQEALDRISDQPEAKHIVLEWANRSGAAVYTMALLTQEAESAIDMLQDDFFLMYPKEKLIAIVRRFMGEE